MQHTVSSSSSQVAPLQQLQPDRGPRTGPPRNPPATDSTALRCELPVGAPSQLRFKLPVDVEHKAVQLQLLQLARPHMMAFHLSWICLFLTFTTTFAPAALLPVLQDALDLTRTDISNAGIASVCGTIFSRVAMGTMTDAVGPRYSAAIALLGTAPLMFGMALMQTAAGFIALRMLVGLGLSMFVVNQKWMGEMFNRQVLGRATALSAGWGNTGLGVTLLLMPLLYKGFSNLWGPLIAWRAAFMVPAGLQLIAGILVLVLADDTPEGRKPQTSRDWCCSSRSYTTSLAGWQAALLNPRTYLLAGAYAACFGVELTVANIISLYLYNQFHLSLTAAGLLGGCLGLMNIVSRFLGGAASDGAAGRRGMRGRMWVLLLLLLLEGVFCLLVGISHDSLGATLATLFCFGFFGQMACGAAFGIVPFLSHRRSGLTVGVVAAGGNVGSVVTQALFFGFIGLTPYEGFYWMGATVICLAGLTVPLLYWPMWGGLCCGPKSNVTEERFYLSEYSNAERAAGAHLTVLAFAHEAHRERDPVGGKGCSLGSCALPSCTSGCCSRARRSSRGSGPDPSTLHSHRQQQQQQQEVKGGSSQLVPVDAACSLAGSSDRNSGSIHGGRNSGSSATLYAQGPTGFQNC